MLESSGQEGGEGDEAGRAEAGRDHQPGGEGCPQVSRRSGNHSGWTGEDRQGQEEPQPWTNTTCQEGSQDREIWGAGVTSNTNGGKQGLDGGEGNDMVNQEAGEVRGVGGEGQKNTDNGKTKSQSNQQSYSILYSNVRSILNKLLEFQAFVFEQKYDVICLCETFFRDDISNALLNLPGYDMVVRKDGSDTVGGKCRGLLVYCKTSLRASEFVGKEFSVFTECAQD